MIISEVFPRSVQISASISSRRLVLVRPGERDKVLRVFRFYDAHAEHRNARADGAYGEDGPRRRKILLVPPPNPTTPPAEDACLCAPPCLNTIKIRRRARLISTP